MQFNPIALRMAKTLWSFGCSECNRVERRVNIYDKNRNLSDLTGKFRFIWKSTRFFIGPSYPRFRNYTVELEWLRIMEISSSHPGLVSI